MVMCLPELDSTFPPWSLTALGFPSRHESLHDFLLRIYFSFYFLFIQIESKLHESSLLSVITSARAVTGTWCMINKIC